MKKIIMLLILSLFLISSVSASMTYDKSKKLYSFDSPQEIGGTGKSTVELISNTDNCLINCEAVIKFTNEKPTVLTNKIDLKDKKNTNMESSVDIKLLLGKEKGNEIVWTPYTGTKESGTSYLKITGRKKPSDNIDWIINFRGEKLDKWAWWNSSWISKKQINLTAHNAQVILLNLTYSQLYGTQADFDDVRFVNSTETGEFPYYLELKSNSNWAVFRVKIQQNSSFYVYYGNPDASSTSSFSNVYGSDVELSYMFGESTGNYTDHSGNANNGTIQGTIQRVQGKLGSALELNDNNNNYILSASNISITGKDNRTVCFWAEQDTTTNNENFVEWGTDENYHKWNINYYNVAANYLQVSIFYVDIKSAIATNTNYNHHCITSNGTNITWIRNGINIKNMSNSNINTGDSKVYIGHSTYLTIPYDGEIDELIIYSRELPYSEVFDLYNTSTPTYNLSAEVSGLAMDNCTTYTVQLYNFTVVDEETQNILPNATIEVAFSIYDSARESIISNFSEKYEGFNPLTICMNQNITGDSRYSLDGIIHYEDTQNAKEYYNMVNTSLTNETDLTHITLYDLNLSDSTEFQLTFTGSNFLPEPDALVYVERKYVSENQFKTVELPKTDYNGQTVVHLVRNDIIYNIRVLKDGEVLGTFENLVAFCDDYTIGDCNIVLTAHEASEEIYNYDTQLGITYSGPYYNVTPDYITFSYATVDGTSKVIDMNITRNDYFGNISICNTTATTPSGTLSCYISPSIEDSTVNVEIYVDGNWKGTWYLNIDTTHYGTPGLLFFFVMAMSMVLMFSNSKTGVLLSIILTFGAAIGMGLTSGSLIGKGATGIWLIIVVGIGIYKLNSRRNQ